MTGRIPKKNGKWAKEERGTQMEATRIEMDQETMQRRAGAMLGFKQRLLRATEIELAKKQSKKDRALLQRHNADVKADLERR